MKFVNTLVVNGETYVLQDKNAVTEDKITESLEEAKAELVAAVLAALPTYHGEIEEV